MNFKNGKQNSILLGLSVIVSIFWLATASIKNVYRIAIVGAVFEMIWLPMILLTLILPIFCIVLLFREKFNIRSFNFYSPVIVALGWLCRFYS